MSHELDLTFVRMATEDPGVWRFLANIILDDIDKAVDPVITNGLKVVKLVKNTTFNYRMILQVTRELESTEFAIAVTRARLLLDMVHDGVRAELESELSIFKSLTNKLKRYVRLWETGVSNVATHNQALTRMIEQRGVGASQLIKFAVSRAPTLKSVAFGEKALKYVGKEGFIELASLAERSLLVSTSKARYLSLAARTREIMATLEDGALQAVKRIVGSNGRIYLVAESVVTTFGEMAVNTVSLYSEVKLLGLVPSAIRAIQFGSAGVKAATIGVGLFLIGSLTVGNVIFLAAGVVIGSVLMQMQLNSEEDDVVYIAGVQNVGERIHYFLNPQMDLLVQEHPDFYRVAFNFFNTIDDMWVQPGGGGTISNCDYIVRWMLDRIFTDETTPCNLILNQQIAQPNAHFMFYASIIRSYFYIPSDCVQVMQEAFRRNYLSTFAYLTNEEIRQIKQGRGRKRFNLMALTSEEIFIILISRQSGVIRAALASYFHSNPDANYSLPAPTKENIYFYVHAIVQHGGYALWWMTMQVRTLFTDDIVARYDLLFKFTKVMEETWILPTFTTGYSAAFRNRRDELLAMADSHTENDSSRQIATIEQHHLGKYSIVPVDLEAEVKKQAIELNEMINANRTRRKDPNHFDIFALDGDPSGPPGVNLIDPKTGQPMTTEVAEEEKKKETIYMEKLIKKMIAERHPDDYDDGSGRYIPEGQIDEREVITPPNNPPPRRPDRPDAPHMPHGDPIIPETTPAEKNDQIVLAANGLIGVGVLVAVGGLLLVMGAGSKRKREDDDS